MENIIKDNEGKTWINIDYFIEQYNSNRKTLVMPNVSIMNIDKKKLIEKFTKITDIEKVLIFVQPEEIKRIIESYIDTFREKKTLYYIQRAGLYARFLIDNGLYNKNDFSKVKCNCRYSHLFSDSNKYDGLFFDKPDINSVRDKIKDLDHKIEYHQQILNKYLKKRNELTKKYFEEVDITVRMLKDAEEIFSKLTVA